MFPVSSTMNGQVFAFPDTCLTPAPPAPPVPTPYPNIGMCMQALPPTCSLFVKIMMMPAMTKATIIPMTSGDEAGVNMGVASGMIKGPAQYSLGSFMAKAEGQPLVYLGCLTKHNGVSANAPAGAQIAPSQALVTVMG